MPRRKSAASLALLAATVLSTPPARAQPILDHLKCYRVKDTQAEQTYSADLGGLVAEPGCVIRVPAVLACVPASKTDVAPSPPGGGGIGRPNSFMCYKVRCPTVGLPTITARDQFGTRTITTRRARLLCAANAGPTDGGFPATGQTTCWDTNRVVIPCGGTGEDGDIRAGAPLSYADNGDGTITDLNTGLMWEQQTSDGSIHDATNSYTWLEAFTHVATLNGMMFAGHNDWRVPNVKELMSIVNYEGVPALSPVFGPIATGTWSSTNWAAGRTFAWSVEYADGSMQAYQNDTRFAARAVRGG